MNLTALRYFYEASQYKTLTQASQHLHISQPALTKHIKNLEKEYQITLFERKGRYIQLTELGILLIEECHELFQQEKKIERILSTKSNQLIIKIGTTQLNNQELIKHILSDPLLGQNNLELTTENTTSIINKLSKEILDVAILPEQEVLNSFVKTYLYTDHLIFVASPSYCPDFLNQEQLENYQFIKREKGSYLQETLESWAPKTIQFSNQMTSHSDALLACIYQNGIYLCSNLSAESLINEGKLKKITIDSFPLIERRFYLYDSKKELDKSTKELLTKLITIFQNKRA